ncbi:MAG: hypothetical protein ACTS27_00225 [Phycisphaerales bacterium]
MPEENGPYRIRAPLSDADRSILADSMRTAVRDEVLDVVVERLARDLERMVPPPRCVDGALVETRPISAPPKVRLAPDGGPVLARIG